MNLIVSKKNVYGVERVYPVCNKAKLFATISGNKTLLPEVIELIKKLGYKKIYVVKIPNFGPGIAINDRLKRAAY